jgi:hypothetical protein
MATKRLILDLDEDDFAALQEALTRRQLWRDQHGVILPDGESNLPGALLAEICRGWIELCEWKGE